MWLKQPSTLHGEVFYLTNEQTQAALQGTNARKLNKQSFEQQKHRAGRREDVKLAVWR